MKNRIVSVFCIAILFVLVLSTQSFALMFERIADKLQLTAEQKEKFNLQHQKLNVEMKANHDKIKEISAKIKDEIKADNPDRNKIHDYINQINGIMGQMQIKRLDSMLDLREMLTADQKEKFNKMLMRKSGFPR